MPGAKLSALDVLAHFSLIVTLRLALVILTLIFKWRNRLKNRKRKHREK